MWSFEIAEVRLIPVICNRQTHHFTPVLRKALRKPRIFLKPRKAVFVQEERVVDTVAAATGGVWGLRKTRLTNHHIPCAVPFENLPVGLVGAVGHTELSGVVGLQVVFGSLGLDPCEQDLPLHVHLQYSKATDGPVLVNKSRATSLL